MNWNSHQNAQNAHVAFYMALNNYYNSFFMFLDVLDQSDDEEKPCPLLMQCEVNQEEGEMISPWIRKSSSKHFRFIRNSGPSV